MANLPAVTGGDRLLTGLSKGTWRIITAITGNAYQMKAAA